VAVQSSGVTELLSSLDVQRGDVIEMPVSNLGSATTAVVAVNLPQVAGAATWQVETPDAVSAGSSDVTLQVTSGTTSTPVIATAISASTTVVAMYAETSAQITGATPSLTVQDPVTFRSLPVTAINPPVGLTGSDVSVGGFVNVEGQAVYMSSLGNEVTLPTSFGDSVSVSALAASDDEDYVSAGSVSVMVPTGPVTIDLAVPALPQVSALAVSGSGASWTLVGGGSYDYLDIDLWASTNDNYSWSFMAPPGTRSVTLPTLPADLAAPAFDSISVYADEDSSIDGYAAALRQTYGTLPAGDTFQESSVTLTPQAAPRTRAAGASCRRPFAPLRNANAPTTY
jgi:hypothetical protein